jgi:hypothetical protein
MTTHTTGFERENMAEYLSREQITEVKGFIAGNMGYNPLLDILCNQAIAYLEIKGLQ